MANRTPPPKAPSLFADTLTGPAPTNAPQTVTVEQAIESARTGVPIEPPPEPDQAPAGEHTNAPPEPESSPPVEPARPPPEPAKPAGKQPFDWTRPEADARRIPLPFYPSNADEMWRYATQLAQSSMLPKAFYSKDDYLRQRGARIADVMLVLMKGHDLGLKPQQSIATINAIEGRAEVGAQLMVALVRRSGLCTKWRVVRTDELSCVIETRRVGDDSDTLFEYTIEKAERMGLLDKGRDEQAKAKNNWRLQPDTMLRRRCESNLCRMVYPDVVLGMYDIGELTEQREREIALGIDPANVIPMNSMQAGERSLPEGGAPGPIERVVQAAQAAKQEDPLKARLAARATGGLALRCSQCGNVRDPRDSDPCIVCTGVPPGHAA